VTAIGNLTHQFRASPSDTSHKEKRSPGTVTREQLQ